MRGRSLPRRVPARWPCALLLFLAASGCATPAAEPPTLACASPCAFEIATSEDRLWEPHVAADPRDPGHLVAAVAVLRDETSDEPFANGMLVAVTRDGGATWKASELRHGPTAGPDHPLAGTRALADPNVAFLPDGTTLVSGLAYNVGATPVGIAGQAFRIFVARSADGGETFPEIVVVDSDVGAATITPVGHRGLALRGPDAPTMAVAPDGTVHLSWRRMIQATPAEPERSQPLAARSTDGGRTWSEPVPIDVGGRNAVAGQLQAAADGTLYAVIGAWGEGGVIEAKEGYQLLARSTDGGRTWRTAEVDDVFLPGLGYWPTAGLSSAGLHVAYADEDEAGREVVIVRTSTDGGATFGPREQVSEAVAAGGALPTMAGDGTTAFLTWFQPQEDGGARNRLLALSIDASGRSPTVVLDDTLRADATALGEYFGIAVAEGRAMPVWTSEPEASALRAAWIGPAR